MAYIITNGTSYCHRTKTQAVEIVQDEAMATRFHTRLSAEKLLARATRKLKGFAPALVEEKPLPSPSSPESEDPAGSNGSDETVSAQKADNRNASGRKRRSKASSGKVTEPDKGGVPEETPDPVPQDPEAADASTTRPGSEETGKSRETNARRRSSSRRKRRTEQVSEPSGADGQQPVTEQSETEKKENPAAAVQEQAAKPAKAESAGTAEAVNAAESTGTAEAANAAGSAGTAEAVNAAGSAGTAETASASETTNPTDAAETADEQPERRNHRNRRRRSRSRKPASSSDSTGAENTNSFAEGNMTDGAPAAESPSAASSPVTRNGEKSQERGTRNQSAAITGGKQQTGGDKGDRPARGRRQSKPAGASSQGQNSTGTRRRMFTTQERHLIYNRTEGHCGICGRFIPLEEYTIDHIIPLSKGGTNDLDNLQACCSFCNKAKDDSIGDEFFKRIERIFLYQAKLRYDKKQLKKLKKALKELE